MSHAAGRTDLPQRVRAVVGDPDMARAVCQVVADWLREEGALYAVRNAGSVDPADRWFVEAVEACAIQVDPYAWGPS